MIDVPAVVRSRAVAEGADWWLAALDGTVAALGDEWGFTVGHQHDEGTEAVVVDVTLDRDAVAQLAASGVVAHDGTAVLKLVVPRRDAGFDESEAAFLRLAGGRGCPVLYRHDVGRGALLMERLGPSMFALGTPFAERIPALCAATRAIWRPVPAGSFPSGADKAASLARGIAASWEELGRPCSAAAIDHALTCAGRRRHAHDEERAVLVHGDVHRWNALATLDGSGFKLVDPDGYVAEPELDLGVMIREDPLELRAMADPFDAARSVAALCDVDATAVWEWGVVERVSTGLLATKIDLQPEGRHMLAVADWLAGA